MVHILGVGAAVPEVVISDVFLTSIGVTPTDEQSALVNRIGVKQRRCSLPLNLLQETLNRDPIESRKHATATPTSLGCTAARLALERAGISPQQVGLIVAESATPFQTCPSEAQRIGGALGLKVPAYDIVGGAFSFALYLELLLSWKPEKVPEYVLCISTNTPTLQVDYSARGLEPFVFGDAAGAAVLSTRQPGRLRVIASSVRTHEYAPTVCAVGQHLELRGDRLLSSQETQSSVYQSVHALLERASVGKVVDGSGEIVVIGPQLFGCDTEAALSKMPSSLTIAPVVSVQHGYSLGSSAIVALADQWETLKSGDRVVMVHTGDGLWSGSALLVTE